MKRSKEYVYKLNGLTYYSGLDITMSFIGGKWKTIILWHLKNNTLRFGELKKKIPEITEKMLSTQLKGLEEDLLIARKIYAQVPIKVEYTVTDFGKTLLPFIEIMAKWGKQIGEKKGNVIEVIK